MLDLYSSVSAATLKDVDVDRQRLTDADIPRRPQFPHSSEWTTARRWRSANKIDHLFLTDVDALLNDNSRSGVEVFAADEHQRGVPLPCARSGIAQRYLAFVVPIGRNEGCIFGVLVDDSVVEVASINRRGLEVGNQRRLNQRQRNVKRRRRRNR